MGGIINLFKKLLGGIFGFIGGLFGGKKAEAGDNTKVKAKKSQGYYLELDESKAASAPALAAAVAPAMATAATEATPAKKTPKSSKKAKAPTEKAPAPAAPVANPLNLPQPTVTFAEASQVPEMVTPRRRPGANMSSYLTMAKSMGKA